MTMLSLGLLTKPRPNLSNAATVPFRSKLVGTKLTRKRCQSYCLVPPPVEGPLARGSTLGIAADVEPLELLVDLFRVGADGGIAAALSSVAIT